MFAWMNGLWCAGCMYGREANSACSDASIVLLFQSVYEMAQTVPRVGVWLVRALADGRVEIHSNSHGTQPSLSSKYTATVTALSPH